MEDRRRDKKPYKICFEKYLDSLSNAERLKHWKSLKTTLKNHHHQLSEDDLDIYMHGVVFLSSKYELKDLE